MTDKDEQHPSVIICGGGPSGVLASILLNNIGIKSTVLEKAAEPDQWSSKSYSMVCGEKGQISLGRGGCLELAKNTGNLRSNIYMVDGKTGNVMAIPRQQATPGIGFSRPQLVDCIEKVASDLPHVTLKRGSGVSRVTRSDGKTLQVYLDDDSVISGTHVIGADGKWSKVRQSFPSLNSQAKIVTCPSFVVSLFSPSVPEGWKKDGTHLIKPPEECMFYIIASQISTGGMSISMVCFDQTVEKYPWLEPPTDMKLEDYGKGGWEDEHSAIPSGCESDSGLKLSDQLEQLFQEVIPGFHAVLDKEAYKNARINRRVSWLQMKVGDEGKDVSYSTNDGLVALIGDAAHAMTPSMGEGGNCAMESAVKLVDAIASKMEEKEEAICTIETMSEAFVQYGLSRPKEVQPIQEMSAARNNKKR